MEDIFTLKIFHFAEKNDLNRENVVEKSRHPSTPLRALLFSHCSLSSVVKP